MWNNKQRNVLTHARVNFSQSETSLFLRGGTGGELNFELLLWLGINRNDSKCILEKKWIPLNFHYFFPHRKKNFPESCKESVNTNPQHRHTSFAISKINFSFIWEETLYKTKIPPRVFWDLRAGPILAVFSLLLQNLF